MVVTVVMVTAIVMVGACTYAPGKRGPYWRYSNTEGASAASRHRLARKQGLQGLRFAPFPLLTIPHRPALAGLSARWPTPSGANRKPCKSCFLARRWRNAALAPPVLEYRQEGPLSPGACMHARAITIGADHHHRHNHHGRTDLRCRSESRRCSRIRSKPWNIL